MSAPDAGVVSMRIPTKLSRNGTRFTENSAFVQDVQRPAQHLAVMFRSMLVALALVNAGAAFAQGKLELKIISDKETAAPGDIVTFQATVKNAGSVVLSGTLMVSVTMQATFESATADRALTCAKRTAGTPGYNCTGTGVIMVPNGTITITAVVRIPVNAAIGESLTFFSNAAGFEGQVASALFRLKIMRRGVDFRPQVSVSQGRLEITQFSDGQVSVVPKELSVERGGLVSRSYALIVRVDVANLGDTPNQREFLTEVVPEMGRPVSFWPGCNDFPNLSASRATVIPPGEAITLCQAFKFPRYSYDVITTVATVTSSEDANPSNNESEDLSFLVELPRRGEPIPGPVIVHVRQRGSE